MTRFEMIKKMTFDEMKIWLQCLVADCIVRGREDFNEWALTRDLNKKWAEDYLNKEMNKK